MPRNKVKRTPSQEAIHKAEIKQKNAERARKRRSEQTEEQKDAENERKKQRRQQLNTEQKNQRNAEQQQRTQAQRSQQTEAERAEMNESQRQRTQAHRAQLSEAERAERNETERLRLEAQRAQQSDAERAAMNEAQRQRTEAQRAQLSEAERAERNETERLRLEAQRAQQSEAESAAMNEAQRQRTEAQRAQLSEAERAERNETERLRLEAQRAQQSEAERAAMNEAQRQRTEAQRAQLSEAERAERNETERLRLEAQRAQQSEAESAAMNEAQRQRTEAQRAQLSEAERAERNETERLRLEAQRAQQSEAERAAMNEAQRQRTEAQRAQLSEAERAERNETERLRLEAQRAQQSEAESAAMNEAQRQRTEAQRAQLSEAERAERNETERLRLEAQRAQQSEAERAAMNEAQRQRTEAQRAQLSEAERAERNETERLRLEAQRAQQSEAERAAMNEAQRQRTEAQRAQLSEAERAERNETERLRLEAQRAQQSDAERAAMNEAQRQRTEAQRAQLSEAERAERNETERLRLEAQRAQQSEAESAAMNEAQRQRTEAQRAQLSEAERAERNETERLRLEAQRAQQSEAERAAMNEAQRQRTEAQRAQLSEAERAERNETERLRLEAQRAQQSEAERAAMNEAQRQRTEAQRAQLSEAERAERNETERLRLEAQRAQQTEAERVAMNEAQRERIEAQRAQASSVIRAAQNAEQRERTQNRRSNFDENQARAENAAARLRMQLKRNKVTKLCAAGFEIDDNGEAHYGGPLNFVCTHCGAKHFANEKVANKGSSFYGCCQHGTVKVEIPDYPEELKQLFDLAEFRKDIRVFNNAHAFGSFNADVVNFGINRPGPYTYIIHGQSYYQINTALRNEEGQPKSHGQLYIVDPEEAVENRLNVFNRLNPDITKTLSRVLSEINAQAKAFQMLYEQLKLQIEIAQEMGIDPLNLTLHFGIKPGQDQRRFNLQASNEVAAVFGTNDDGEIPDSYITIYDKDQKKLKTVNAMDPNVEPWLYPIFFPTGKYLWHPDLKKINSNQRLTRSAYAKYMISIRDGEFNAVLHGGRLFQQWLVDTALKILKDRVNYLKQHQKQLLRDSYANIDEFMKKFGQDNNAQSIGAKFILPSSHPGSPRNMEQLYQDAMAIVRRFGKPDLFITMTCNPNWKEIVENLLEGQTPADRPDLVARVFKQKKDYLINLISKEGYFGKCKAHVYTIEFQKRGLPHAHILVTLEGDYKMRTAEVIDRYISAQLPDPELYPRLHELVVKHMIHGPCGPRCEKDGKCSKHFPHEFQEETTLDEDGYPSYARPNNGITVTKSSGFVVDNRYVVPHCPNLLLLLNCHINVEVVSSIKAVKYLYKYIFKGHDSAAMKIVDGTVVYDECESFLDSRYMGAAEAVWRMLGYELHGQSHSISRLPIHLPGEQKVSFVDAENEDELKAALEKMSMLMEYFELNARDPKARELYYHQIPEKYTWKKISEQGQPTKMQWCERKASFNVIGRMYSVSPTNQELFHLRILLNHVKGATSFEDLKKADGQTCQTFTQTCLELGLVKDDKEWEKVLNEAKLSLMPYQMRLLFARLLIHCNPLAPQDLWETFKSDLSDDFARNMSEEAAIKKAYREIQRILEIENKSLSDFPTMPQNVDFDEDYDIYDPIYDQQIGDQMFGSMNDAQKAIVEKVKGASSGENEHKLFYLDGPGGSGKTYTYTTLWHLLRASGKKVATMAYTGIAAILLPEGKTCHKTLGLTVPLYSDSNSTITPNSKEGKKLLETDVFIWDEAPMAPRYALEIMDRLLRDLTKVDEPFGGKILLLGGDFRQLLPVRKNGTRSECVNLSIKNSELWNNFETLTLTQNMRANSDEVEFANFLLKIGEAKLNDNYDNVEFPEGFEVETDLVQEIFGHLIEQKRFDDVASSAILSARNADVDELNKEVVDLLPCAGEKRYTSVDTASDGEALQELLTQEYLNSLNPTSLPPHELNLKKNTVVMLIRNLSQAEGLCNGTRLLVIGLLNHTLQCKILTGDKKGETVFIHRILLYNEENYPFTLARRQFPVKIAFAITINKSQGGTFEKIGLDLRKDVFNHGQLYVACSRVKSASGLKIYLGKQRLSKKVKNFVYKEIID